MTATSSKHTFTAGPWHLAGEIPPVPKGQMREYVIAVRRARNGKVYEFAACYLNAYPLEYQDCCPKGDGCDGNGCDDGCPTTGWFDQTGDDYYSSMFRGLSLDKGDEHLGWIELPRWEHGNLIAEAGTVATETGLTPRQLAERCKELEGVLQGVEDLSKPGQTVNVSQATDIICDIWNAARAALSKAQKGGM